MMSSLANCGEAGGHSVRSLKGKAHNQKDGDKKATSTEDTLPPRPIIQSKFKVYKQSNRMNGG
jgi:hypothetical protein